MISCKRFVSCYLNFDCVGISVTHYVESPKGFNTVRLIEKGGWGSLYGFVVLELNLKKRIAV